MTTSKVRRGAPSQKMSPRDRHRPTETAMLVWLGMDLYGGEIDEADRF
jgi:hypothetical protein